MPVRAVRAYDWPAGKGEGRAPSSSYVVWLERSYPACLPEPCWSLIGLALPMGEVCDPVVVQALVTAAHMLRLQPVMEPLVTVPSLVVGADRHDWARRGFVAVDMETGLLAGQQLRVATVRVVLDGPEHEISPDWLWSPEALRRPALWRELFRLSRVAPYYALRAAHVLKTGVGLVSTRHTC